MFKIALLLISALALAQQASGTDTCNAAVTALINALTAAKLDTDAKLKTECETVMNSTQYTDACKDALNAKTQELVTKDCPEPTAEPEPTDEPSGSTMTSLSAAVAMAVVLPLLRQ